MHAAHLLRGRRVAATGEPAAPAGEDQGLRVDVLAELGVEHDARRLTEDLEHLHSGGVEGVVQPLALVVGLAVQAAAGPAPAPAAPELAARLDRQRALR